MEQGSGTGAWTSVWCPSQAGIAGARMATGTDRNHLPVRRAGSPRRISSVRRPTLTGPAAAVLTLLLVSCTAPVDSAAEGAPPPRTDPGDGDERPLTEGDEGMDSTAFDLAALGMSTALGSPRDSPGRSDSDVLVFGARGPEVVRLQVNLASGTVDRITAREGRPRADDVVPSRVCLRPRPCRRQG